MTREEPVPEGHVEPSPGLPPRSYAATAVTAAKPAKTPARGEGEVWYQSFLWNTGRLISRIVSMVLFRLRVWGQNELPESGAVLLVTNHQSFLDPWLIGIAPSRQVHYMARDTLFKGGFLQWLLESLNSFPVRRGQGDRGAIRTATERLNRGYMVNIFPEGTRSEDGTIGPIAPGMALILNGCKVPVKVIPVIIDGAFEAWPRSATFPHPQGIRIMHGKAIPAEEIAGMRPDELARRVREELVKLQGAMGSRHAEASARRLVEETTTTGNTTRSTRRGTKS